MPIIEPGMGDVHVDVPLSNVATAYLQSPEGFVADHAFPVVPVAKQSNKYFTVPKGAWFRNEMQVRAPGTESAGRTHSMSTADYSCEVWALHENLSDQVRANYDNPLMPEREITEGLAQAALISKEVGWAATYFTTSVWTTDQTGVDSSSPSTNQFIRWDRGDSTPIENLRAGSTRMHNRTGRRANKLILGREVWDVLVDHPDILGRLDRGQTDGPAMVKRQALAALLELDEVLVMDGVYNAAVEGATDDYDFIGGKSALLVYAAPRPGIYVPSAGYTFTWNGLLGGSALTTVISRFRMAERKSDRIEIEMAWDQKVVGSDLGSFFTTAIS